MYYSIPILLELIAELSYDAHYSSAERSFDRVSLLPQDPALLNESCLYVCPLSRALDFRAGGGTAFMLCLRDRFKDGGESALSEGIIISENISLDELFSSVQESFLQLNEWIGSMHSALIRGGDFQELLDLSEGIIGNTINISDSALTLLACTQRIPTRDEASLQLRQYGYHLESMVARFRSNKSFQRWQMAGDTIEINPADSQRPYASLLRVFHREKSTYFTHVIMLCDHKPYSPALHDKFRILVENLEVCVKRREARARESNGIAGSVLSSIISGTVWRPEDIKSRALSAGLPLTGDFSLMAITPPDDASIMGGRLERELKALFSEAFVVQYANEIVVLCTQSCWEEAPLSALLAKYDARCGCSLPFRAIEDLRSAYQQASLSMRFCPVFKGEPLLNETVPQRRPRISYYRNELLFYLLGASPLHQEIWKDSFYGRLVFKLHELDALNGTERLKLLYCYLICQGHATEAGAMLHMNRNNVVYHITRLEEQYGLDLSNAGERLNLLVSCCMLQLYGPLA